MSILNFENIHFLPSFHNCIQFSLEVRKAFNKYKPEVIAVELPDIYYSDVIQAVSRLPKLTMLCLDHGKDTYEYIPIFPSDSMIEGIRIAKDNKIPITFIDMAVKEYHVQEEGLKPPDDYAINSIGLEKFYELNKDYYKTGSVIDTQRESNMAFHLNRLNKNFKSVLFIGGMAHWENIKKILKEETFMFHPHELDKIKTPFLAKPGDKALASLLNEIPYVVFQYELARRFNLPFDKWKVIIKLIQEAKFTPLVDELEITVREFNNFIDYSKKLAFIDDKILPDLYNLLLAAKQTLGDDYGIELLDLALKYPFKEEEDLPVIELSKDKKSFMMGMKKITLKRKLPDFSLKSDPTQQWEELELVRKKKDELPENYMNDWFFFGFYSHLPEDHILEGFIDRLKNKVLNDIIQEPKIKEFSGSLLDGIDMRETIRNYSKGKIYVKELKKEKISIGAWVVIFDDDLSFKKYPWAMSLSAEHHNESDIAFYATNPLLHPVSREIIKAEYGALLAFKPPLPSQKKVMWEELDVIDSLRHYQIVNLAIELSPANGIIYVSSKPPESYFYQMAANRKKQIYHIPLNRLSNRNLKKIKRFHLLKSKITRNKADDYI